MALTCFLAHLQIIDSYLLFPDNFFSHVSALFSLSKFENMLTFDKLTLLQAGSLICVPCIAQSLVFCLLSK